MYIEYPQDNNVTLNLTCADLCLQTNYSTKSSKPEIPKNPLSSVYSATDQKENGVVYDKKPFKLTLESGKTYHWCLCGRSKSQPLCDGTHKDVYLKITQRY